MEHLPGERLRQLTAGVSICFGLFLLVSTVPVALAQDRAEELRLLKAAFIYNFAKFTRWPEGTWEEKDAKVILCTTGADELAGTLQRLGGKTVRGRKVTILALQGSEAIGRCHLLYVARSKQDQYDDIVASLKREPVLTVSEIADFSRSGGIIELYLEQDRLRFSVNQNAALKAGLLLDSRLLNLAAEVER